MYSLLSTVDSKPKSSLQLWQKNNVSVQWFGSEHVLLILTWQIWVVQNLYSYINVLHIIVKIFNLTLDTTVVLIRPFVKRSFWVYHSSWKGTEYFIQVTYVLVEPLLDLIDYLWLWIILINHFYVYDINICIISNKDVRIKVNMVDTKK